jgi:membrane protease YdiL (CAAX protease family)
LASRRRFGRATAERKVTVERQQDIQGRLFARDSTLFTGPPLYEPRTPWGAPSALLVALAIIMVSGAVGMLVIVWTEGGFAALDRMPASDPSAGTRMFAVWQVLVVLLTLLAATRGGVREVLSLRDVPHGLRTLLAALGLLALLQVAMAGIQFFLIKHDMLADLRLFYDMVRGPDWILTAAVIGIGAPLSEELLFRGFLQSALARTRLGFWWAALITAALWTTLHAGYSAVGLVEVFSIGLIFSWLLWRTGSLWVPIFCHAVYNSLIVLVLRFTDLPPPPT